VILDELTISADALAAQSGWEAKPEGFCKGPVCVPAPEAQRNDGTIDVETLAGRLGMAIVHDADSGAYAVGPETLGQALTTAELPDLPLEDFSGNPFDLGSLAGRKVLLVAWASW